MFRAGAAMVVVISAGCSGKSPAPAPEPGPPPLGDAGADAVAPHVADNGTTEPVRALPKRPGRPIEVILRSVPLGANVAVDGTPVGVTPQMWSGETGGEHEFTFTIDGYSMARYRFIPITSGIVYARLEPVAEEPDAGVAPPPELVQPGSAVAPPITGVVDAAPVPLAPPDAFVPDAPPSGLGPQP